jgi:hypothetical protein
MTDLTEPRFVRTANPNIVTSLSDTYVDFPSGRFLPCNPCNALATMLVAKRS